MLRFFCCTILLFFFSQAQAQNNWVQTPERGNVFIENKGQFDKYACEQSGAIKFAIDEGAVRILFGERGIVYSFLKATKIPKGERAEKKSVVNAQADLTNDAWNYVAGKFLFESDKVWMQWTNSSATSIEALDACSDYHSYTYQNGEEYININNIAAYRKLVYHNHYPGIDLIISIHPQGGYKYEYVLKAGADASMIQSVYSRDIQIVDNEVHIPTKFGDIVDHKPIAYYQQADSHALPISFKHSSGNQITFTVADYDHNQTLVIDPWVQTPNFNTTWKCIWECERDAAGNVYIIGGIMPMQVLKYNSGGTLQWTYNTPYDTSNVWLGTFATDDAGNCYITAGSTAQIQKINTAAALQWNNANPGGIFSGAEFWSIAFNCDQTTMMVGGTGGSALVLTAAVYNIDMNTGAVLGSQDYAQGATFSIPPNVQEVRAICSSSNGKYYFLTQDTVGAFHQNFSLCNPTSSLLFKNSSSYNFGYKCENYRYDNSGICAIKANDDFFYTQNGTSVHKRSLANGAIVATAAIPGGGNTVTLGENAAHNSGIDIDDCGNVYVGSKSSVVKYDANLVQLATYPVAFNVYDVHVTAGGELIAAGSTGNSGSANRTGYIEMINVNACNPLTIICCDATICPVPNACVTGNTIQLTAATPGGVWSGPGVSAGGIFNPAMAGVGTHTIIYTLVCGADSVVIVVSPCQDMEACVETDGTVTVSNGVAPYTWSYFQAASSTPITTQAECVACGYTWFFGTCLNGVIPVTDCNTPAQWVNFATGTNATIPGAVTQFQISDNSGTVTLFTLATLPPCDSCPTILVDNILQLNCTCTGGNDGSVAVDASGGNAPYTFLWSNGATTSSITNLSAGQYIVTATDADGCTGTLTVTITEPANSPLPDVQFSITGSNICLTDSTTATNQNIEPQTTYSWDIGYGPLLNTTSVTIVAAQLGIGTHNITLTATNVCGTEDSTVTLTVVDCTLPPPVADYTLSSTNICAGDCITVTNNSIADPAATYEWDFPFGTPSNPITFDPGSICYPDTATSDVSLTVTNPDGQQATLITTVTIVNCTVPPPVAIFTINTNPICAGDCVGFNNTSTYAAGATFAWTFPGGVPATANTLNPGLICFANTGTADVKLVVTNPDGQADSLTITLTIDNCVNPPVASFLVNNNTICSGDCVSLTNTSTAPITATHQWTFTGGVPNSFTGVNPPAVCYSTAGSYTLELIISDASGNDTATVTITVNDCPPPIAIFTINTNPVCAGDCVGFNNTSTYAAGATFAWTFPGGVPATANTLNPGLICFANTGTSDVKLVVTNPDGQADSLTITLTIDNCVNPPDASFLVNNSTICSGDCVSLSNTSTAPITATHQWTFTGGVPNSFTGVNPPAVCYSTAGNYTLELIISDASGNDTATVTITVNDCPLPVALFSTSATNICVGQSVTFTDQSTNATTWNWVFSGGTPSSFNASNPPAITYDTAGSYIALLTITDGAGQDSSYFVIINVSDCIFPNAAFTGTGTDICTGECVQYSDSSQNATAWFWSFPGGVPSTSFDQNPPLICYPVAGVYPVTLIVSNSSGNDTLTVIPGTIVHNPVPVSLSFNNYTLETGDSIQFLAGGGVSYLWQPGETLSSDTIPDPTATPLDTTLYTVIMTDQYGCTSTATITVNVHPPFVVFVPNTFSPNGDGVNDLIQVYASVPLIEMEFYIFDRWGTRVFSSYIYGEKWDGTFRGKACNTGVYAYYFHARFADRSQISGHGDITLLK